MGSSNSKDEVQIIEEENIINFEMITISVITHGIIEAIKYLYKRHQKNIVKKVANNNNNINNV